MRKVEQITYTDEDENNTAGALGGLRLSSKYIPPPHHRHLHFHGIFVK